MRVLIENKLSNFEDADRAHGLCHPPSDSTAACDGCQNPDTDHVSDGRPEDYNDNYRGKYGIADTRQALIEDRRSGIHPFFASPSIKRGEIICRACMALRITR